MRAKEKRVLVKVTIRTAKTTKGTSRIRENKEERTQTKTRTRREESMVTLRYNTIQYNTIQYNTIQYNTVQYETPRCRSKTKTRTRVKRRGRACEKRGEKRSYPILRKTVATTRTYIQVSTHSRQSVRDDKTETLRLW